MVVVVVIATSLARRPASSLAGLFCFCFHSSPKVGLDAESSSGEDGVSNTKFKDTENRQATLSKKYPRSTMVCVESVVQTETKGEKARARQAKRRAKAKRKQRIAGSPDNSIVMYTGMEQQRNTAIRLLHL